MIDTWISNKDLAFYEDMSELSEHLVEKMGFDIGRQSFPAPYLKVLPDDSAPVIHNIDVNGHNLINKWRIDVGIHWLMANMTRKQLGCVPREFHASLLGVEIEK